MGAVNLAIVFGMGLAPEIATGFGVSPDLGVYQTMVKLWITHAHAIFPEIDDDEISEQGSVCAMRPDSADVVPPCPNCHSNESPSSGVEQDSRHEMEHTDDGDKQTLELVAF